MKFLYKYAVSALILFSLTACSFLAQYPDSQTNTKIDNLAKIDQLLAGAYPKTSYFRFLELRTDNVAEVDDPSFPSTRLNLAMYYWKNYTEEDVDSPTAYWNDCWRGIAQANIALQALAQYKDKQNPRIQALYGEAFLIRAYLNLMLINIWGANYDGSKIPGTNNIVADTIPALPYLELPEKYAFVNYKPLSLHEFYKKIERDILYGTSLINDDYFSVNKSFRFNKKAAYALATRYYAYVANWEKVLEYSSLPLGANPASLFLAYKNIPDADPTVDFLINAYSAVNSPRNLLMASVESNWQTVYKKDKYCLTNSRAGELFFGQGLQNPFSYALQLPKKSLQKVSLYNYYFPKFINYDSGVSILNPKRGHYTYNVLLSTSEVYIHRMEALAMTGDIDQATTMAANFYVAKHRKSEGDGTSDIGFNDLNNNVKPDIRKAIQPFYRPLTADQSLFLQVSSFMCRMQFVHEGLRWFDIRRFNLRINRNRTVADQKVNYILQPEDARKVLPLPQNVHFQKFEMPKLTKVSNKSNSLTKEK